MVHLSCATHDAPETIDGEHFVVVIFLNDLPNRDNGSLRVRVRVRVRVKVRVRVRVRLRVRVRVKVRVGVRVRVMKNCRCSSPCFWCLH